MSEFVVREENQAQTLGYPTFTQYKQPVRDLKNGQRKKGNWKHPHKRQEGRCLPKQVKTETAASHTGLLLWLPETTKFAPSNSVKTSLFPIAPKRVIKLLQPSQLWNTDSCYHSSLIQAKECSAKHCCTCTLPCCPSPGSGWGSARCMQN